MKLNSIVAQTLWTDVTTPSVNYNKNFTLIELQVLRLFMLEISGPC